jgi:hypothetical protein
MKSRLFQKKEGTKIKRIIFLIFILVFLGSCVGSNFAWADIFNIYIDSGIPHGSELYTWQGSGGSFQTIQDQEAPERIAYQKTVSQNWAGWGVFFHDASGDYTKNLSGYAQGYLKFFVKTPVNLKVEIREQGPSGPVRTKYISNYGWNGANQWQEITIPISAFAANLTQIYSPFMITAQASATFYVDDARWVIPISGYSPSSVEVNGHQLLVAGNLFNVKGVAAEFTPIGEYSSGYDWSLFIDDYATDISLIKAMGANVIRTYFQRPTQKQALDRLYENGIYVIMGFPVDAVYGSPEQIVDFSNSVVRANIKARFLDMVAHWKSHPGILIWCFGNEVNSVLENHGVLADDWYSLVEECAQAAHQLEGPNYHPVTTANADQANWDIGNPLENADDASLPSLDLWSLQLYRGETFGDLFTNYENLSNKPFLLTEFGCDAYDGRYHQENQSLQSDYLLSQYLKINENLSSLEASKLCLGGVAFSWRDGWYKSNYGTASVHNTQTDWINYNYTDYNMNEEWWGIAAISDNGSQPDVVTPRIAYATLRDIFKDLIFFDKFDGTSIDATKWTARDRATQSNGKAVLQGDSTIYRQDSIHGRKNYSRDKNLTFKVDFSFGHTNPGFHICLSGGREWDNPNFRMIWLTINGGSGQPGFRILAQKGTDINSWVSLADSNIDEGFPNFQPGTNYTVVFRFLGDPGENQRVEVYLYETALPLSSIRGPVCVWDLDSEGFDPEGNPQALANDMDWDPRISAEIYDGTGTSYVDAVYIFGPSDAILEQNVPQITGFQGKEPYYYAGENIVFDALGNFGPGADDPSSNTTFTWAKHQSMPEYPASGSYAGFGSGRFRMISPSAGTYYFTVRLISDTGLMDARRFSVEVRTRGKPKPQQMSSER